MYFQLFCFYFQKEKAGQKKMEPEVKPQPEVKPEPEVKVGKKVVVIKTVGKQHKKVIINWASSRENLSSGFSEKMRLEPVSSATDTR